MLDYRQTAPSFVNHLFRYFEFGNEVSTVDDFTIVAVYPWIFSLVFTLSPLGTVNNSLPPHDNFPPASAGF